MRTVKTDRTARLHRLIWVFAGQRYHFVGFVVLWFSVKAPHTPTHTHKIYACILTDLITCISNCRLKLQKCVTDQLYDFAISKDWKLNARPCSPRVLFMFETCSIDVFSDEQELTPGGFRPPPRQQVSRQSWGRWGEVGGDLLLYWCSAVLAQISVYVWDLFCRCIH